MKREYEIRFLVEIDVPPEPDYPTDAEIEEANDEAVQAAVDAWRNDLLGDSHERWADHINEIVEVV